MLKFRIRNQVVHPSHLHLLNLLRTKKNIKKYHKIKLYLSKKIKKVIKKLEDNYSKIK